MQAYSKGACAPTQPRRLAVAISMALLASAATAAPERVRPTADEQVIVSADPLRRAQSHIIQPYAVIEREALVRENLRNIGEAVSNELGVTSSDFGAAVGRPVIRGLSGARVQVLDDGVGTMDVSSLSPDHAVAVTPVFARQVEILRGPATLLYGSAASGGLVNVVDDRILDFLPERPSGEVYTHYDTASEGRTGALMLETALGKHFALHLDALGEESENYEIPGYGPRIPEADSRLGRLDNSQSELENFAGGLSYIGSRGFLGISVQRMDRDYGVPGGHHHHEEHHAHEEGAAEEEEAAPETGVTVNQAQTRFDLKGELRDPLPGITAVRTRWGFNDHTHTEYEAPGLVGTLLLNNAYDGRFEFLHAPVAGFTGVFGMQRTDRDFDARGEEAFVPPSNQIATAGFLLEERDFGQIHGEFGARFEHSEARDLLSGQRVDFDVHALSAGLSRLFHDTWEAGLSVTHAGRAPALEELFASGPHLATNTFEIGDAGLDVETSTNIDLSWRKVAGRWQLDMGLFYNDITDFIFAEEQDGNGDGVADRVEPDFLDTGLVVDEPDALLLVRQTQRDAHFWGFEFESRFMVFEDRRGRLDWRLWSDYVEGRLSGGDTVPRLPPLRFGTGLAWSRDAWTTELRLTRVTDQDDTSALELPTNGYTLLDVHAEYTVPLPGDRALVFFARGNNLLDEEVRRHTSFLKEQAPQAGASGLFGFRCLF